MYRLIPLTILAAGLGVFLISCEGWLDRLTATDAERETRMIIYEQTWQAIQSAPWTSYGIGGYEQTFPMFADYRISNTDKAHNDWLETMFELGLPAALIWFAVLGGLGLRCIIGFFRRRRDHVYHAVGINACVLIGLHSLVDFSLQIPAVAMAITLAVLLGVEVAQSRSSKE